LNIVAIILMFFFSIQVAQAGTFYLHDHPSYWWYVVEQPAFSAIIPSVAQNYFQRSIFGMEVLEMTFANGTIVMEVIHQPGKDIEAVRASLEARYKPLVKNVALISNKEITTSNNLKAHFYAYEATGANGKKVMLRSVFFQKGEHVVYLTMFLNADQFQGDTREYWIRAVNGFEWN
ncbi:MAG: hypothetical protein GX956_04115, partial [Firmicutes bacterium]|nr:hypothetical protein [Bacillota bacterium]